jgi:hypothetical protein
MEYPACVGFSFDERLHLGCLKACTPGQPGRPGTDPLLPSFSHQPHVLTNLWAQLDEQRFKFVLTKPIVLSVKLAHSQWEVVIPPDSTAQELWTNLESFFGSPGLGSAASTAVQPTTRIGDALELEPLVFESTELGVVELTLIHEDRASDDGLVDGAPCARYLAFTSGRHGPAAQRQLHFVMLNIARSLNLTVIVEDDHFVLRDLSVLDRDHYVEYTNEALGIATKKIPSSLSKDSWGCYMDHLCRRGQQLARLVVGFRVILGSLFKRDARNWFGDSPDFEMFRNGFGDMLQHSPRNQILFFGREVDEEGWSIGYKTFTPLLPSPLRSRMYTPEQRQVLDAYLACAPVRWIREQSDKVNAHMKMARQNRRGTYGDHVLAACVHMHGWFFRTENDYYGLPHNDTGYIRNYLLQNEVSIRRLIPRGSVVLMATEFERDMRAEFMSIFADMEYLVPALSSMSDIAVPGEYYTNSSSWGSNRGIISRDTLMANMAAHVKSSLVQIHYCATSDIVLASQRGSFAHMQSWERYQVLSGGSPGVVLTIDQPWFRAGRETTAGLESVNPTTLGGLEMELSRLGASPV